MTENMQKGKEYTDKEIH